MSNYNQPAFPTIEHGFDKVGTPAVFTTDGMTLRDYFAAKALSTMNIGGLAVCYDGFAENAYKMADAMLKARSI